MKVKVILKVIIYGIGCALFCAQAQGNINNIVMIAKANCDSDFSSQSDDFIALDNINERTSFWNHIANFPNEFSTVKSTQKNYQLQQLNTKSCYQSSTQAITLVKKISDWNRQHGNGVEFQFAEKKLSFSSFKFFNIRLKLEMKHSYLPNKKTIKAALSPLVNNEVLAELDDDKAYLSFSFYGDNHAKNDIATFYGEIIMTIDPKLYGDTWLDIRIPFSLFSYSSQMYYKKQAMALSQLQQEKLNGLLITAETKYGTTLRHYLLDDFPEKAPEILKEIAIEIEQVLLSH